MPRELPLLPSGRQTVIERGDQRLVVVEVGGGLRRYQVGGEDVLDGYAADDMCRSGRGQLLVPWPNRLADGSYRFGGEEHQAPLTEPEAHNAIHGLARYASWQVADQREEAVTMVHRLPAQPGYPWTLDLATEYRLDDAGLTVTISAVNRSGGPCPYGAGAHPYLRLPAGTVDDWVLRSPGATRYLTDDRSLPVGTEAVDGSPFDFRSPRPIGDARLDTAFRDLERDPSGRATVELSAGAGSRRVSLWLGPEFAYLMLFTGDSLPDAARRRQGIGVEPMTCAPNAFRSGDGTVVLDPGQRVDASWGIAVEA
jgi:aldose 1-epimerase